MVELGYTECQGCNLSLDVGSYYILNISLPTISQRSQLMESAWVAALLKILQERAMRRSGCRTSEAHDHAQTPLDTTTIPIQRPEFGSSNGEPSPLARGMDYDKIGDIHKWRRMDTTYMSSTQGKRTDRCRIMELSNSMDPTKKERVGELHLRYFSPAIGPTTKSKNEQLRLDAAAMVVGSSWSWAYLQSGLEHDVPEFMIARRKAAQAQAYALPRSHLMHGTEEVWRQLEVWFLE